MSRFIKIGAAGEQLPADANCAALLDPQTSLMWALPYAAAGERVKHAQAAEAAAQVQAGGFTDWRLPTAAGAAQPGRPHALQSGDRSRTSSPMPKSALYWSSTPDAEDPADCAWGVHFYGGSTGITYRNSTGFVRAVRSVAPAAPGQ
jgi:hypothetical protein